MKIEHKRVVVEPIGQRKTVMVVDDETMIVDVYASVLQNAGYDVVHARSAREAMTCASIARNIALAIVDYNLPDQTGSELAQWFRKRHERAEVLIMSATPDLLSLSASEVPFAARMDKAAPIEDFVALVGVLLSPPEQSSTVQEAQAAELSGEGDAAGLN